MPALRFQLRRGTAAEWASINPVLAPGEPGVETDTGQQKLGDGVKTWSALQYVTAGWQGVQDALQARTDAQAAAGVAAGHVSAAAGQASAAATQVSLAAGQVTLATAAKTGAETARTGAQTAKADAESARTDAQTARTGAETAKAGAETARTDAQTAKTQAETARDAAGAFYGTTIVVGAVDSQGHLVLTRSNGTTADAGYVVGPPITASVTGTVTGPDTPGIPGAQGLPGPAGPAGGIVINLITSGQDLDNFTTTGVWACNNGTFATLPLHYPNAGKAGVLYVHRIHSTFFHQVYYAADAFGKLTYERVQASGVWSPWVCHPSSRVDQTAGRAIYQWDDLNGREQLVYGDTGWRELSGVLLNGWVANSLLIRRVNNMVSLKIYWLNPTAATSDIFYVLPSGFIRTHGAGVLLFPKSSTEVAFLNLASTGMQFNPRGATAVYGSGGFCEVSWSTVDAWPTTLPGTASGNVPNL